MSLSIKVVTGFTSFAHDLKEQLQALGHHVTLSFEMPSRCRALYGGALPEDEALWAALAPLKLSARSDPELSSHELTLELGGLDVLKRTSQVQLTLEGASEELCNQLEYKLEPVGFGSLTQRRGRPTQAVARFGGAPHVLVSLVSWYAAQEGLTLEWARVWELSEGALRVSLPERAPPEGPQHDQPNAWQLRLECDDEALAAALERQLRLEGFESIQAQITPLPKVIGAVAYWGLIQASELVQLSLWGAISEVDKALLDRGESLSPRCEIKGATLSSPSLASEPTEGLSPTLVPSLTLSVSSVSSDPALRLQRLSELSAELELCLRSEQGELSEVARLLRALKPARLQVLGLSEWGELCELLSELDEGAHPPDLGERGLIWGEVRCPRALASLGAWLRDELERLTQRRPRLELSEALGPRELWVLLPKGC